MVDLLVIEFFEIVIKLFDIGCGIGVSLLVVVVVCLVVYCIGLDIFVLMLVLVCQCVEVVGLDVDFIVVDVQCYLLLLVYFDWIQLWLGVMFFEDSQVVFVNLYCVMIFGVGLCFIVWCSVDENLFMIMVECVIGDVLDFLFCVFGVLGQFVFVDGECVQCLLQNVGWNDVEVVVVDLFCLFICKDLLIYVGYLGFLGLVL